MLRPGQIPPHFPHTGRFGAAPWVAYMRAEEGDMPGTMTQTCAVCGLRYASGALLELHVREDHVQQNQPAAPPGGRHLQQGLPGSDAASGA